MKGDTFFCISIIDGALSLYRHWRKDPKTSIDDAVRQLRNGPALQANYDYVRAIELGIAVGWDVFDVDGTRHDQLQKILKSLAMRLKPVWARASYLGPQKVMQFASDNQRQCFEFAGLLDSPPSEKSVSWWDDLGAYFRLENQRKNLEVGREGEKRTLAYEVDRLKREGITKEPIWISLEDNSVGYDVHSFQYMKSGKIGDLRIEVKATRYEPVHFILSRHEWEKAREHPNLHLFHIWNLENGKLTRLSVPGMAKHMPDDRGNGEWREVRVALM